MALTAVSEETLLLLSVLLVLPLFFLIFKYKSPKVSPLPPGPYAWPIIGNLLHIGANLHVVLAQLAETHGPLMMIRLGTQLVVVASSKEAAIEILKTHDGVLSGRYVPQVAYVSNPALNHLSLGWTSECTDQWKFLRTLSKNELFSTRVLDKQTDLREKKVNELLDFLGTKEGKLVRIGDVVYVTLFNVMGNIFLSKDLLTFDIEGEGKGMTKVIKRLVQLLTEGNISDYYPILAGLDLQGLRAEAIECGRKFCDLWASTLNERRGRKGGEDCRTGDFLDVLLDNQFSDEQIHHLFSELLSAGTDTTAATIEWLMAELMKNHEVMDKLREELAREISGGFVKEADLPRLSYLHACVKETLRLHPVGGLLLPRRAAEKCEIMNYTIPKDTKVLVNVWAIGRDPSLWDDPLRFNPERFLGSDLDFRGNNFEYLPFGSGRRICAGMPSALRQIPLLLASLIHHFDWSLPSNLLPYQLDMKEKFSVTLRKEQPLELIPKRRI